MSDRESTYWKLNTDLYAESLVGGSERTLSLRNELEAHVSLLAPWSIEVPECLGFDLAFSRYRLEGAYVGRLYDLTATKIVEEDGERDTARLLILETPLLEETRSSCPYANRSTSINRQLVMPLEDRAFERKIRNKQIALVLRIYERRPSCPVLPCCIRTSYTLRGGGKWNIHTADGVSCCFFVAEVAI